MLVCNVHARSYKGSQQLPRAPGIDLLLFTLNIYPMRGRLQLLQIAVLLYRNLAMQQLNCQVMLCHWVVSRSSLPAQRPLSWKTIIKHVDHEKQPHLVDQLAALQQLYRATKASERLIRSEVGSQICTKYTVAYLLLMISLGLGLSQTE